MDERIGICSYLVTVASRQDSSKDNGLMETLTANWLQTLIADTISQSISQKGDDLECPRVSVRRTTCSTKKVVDIASTLITMSGPERRQAYWLLSQMEPPISVNVEPRSMPLEYSASEQKKPSKEMVAWTMRAISLGDYISPQAVSELIEAVKEHGCE